MRYQSHPPLFISTLSTVLDLMSGCLSLRVGFSYVFPAPRMVPAQRSKPVVPRGAWERASWKEGAPAL